MFPKIKTILLVILLSVFFASMLLGGIIALVTLLNWMQNNIGLEFTTVIVTALCLMPVVYLWAAHIEEGKGA